MSLKLNCPACAGEIDFKSKHTVFAVCSYCRSMVVRHDVDLEAIGKMAELQKDMSPLQLYAGGKFAGEGFSIVGRLKLKWENGIWNEWFCSFDTGRYGWLAEAQGQFMFGFPQEKTGPLPKINNIYTSTVIALGTDIFNVDDIKKATCIGAEGELPFVSPKGREQTSVDLTSEDGQKYACLEYHEDGIHVFVGKYVELEELRMQGLRQLEGW